MITGLLVVIAGLLAVICIQGRVNLNILTEVKKVQQVSDKTACEKTGGKWQKRGSEPASVYSCIMPAKDAGKACTDSSQCQSLKCIPPNTAVSGSRTTGKCYGWEYYVGCTPVVEKGVAQAVCPD